jgi:hypothetical protein
MDGLMKEAAQQTIKRASARLAELLEETRRAVRGERDFDVSDVRRLQEPVGEMAPIVAQASELRRLQPEIAGPLEIYKSQLRELQSTLIQVRIMLHTRQASLQVGQVHNAAVSRWVSALRQTR